MKFTWFFFAAALIAGCTSSTPAPPAPAPAAPGGGGAQLMTIKPHAKGEGVPEKLAAQAKAAAEGKVPGAGPKAGYAAVQAVLTANCVKCHSGPTPKYKLDLTNYDAVMKGGAEGPVIIAGNADSSILDKALHGKGAKQMPPNGPLSDGDIKKVEAWIKAGAKKS